MPIRVPTVTSQQGLDLGTTPQIGAGAGSEYTAGINEAITQLDRAARQYAHVNARLTQQDMKLDVDSKLTQVRDRLVEEDVLLRQEGVEPDQLSTEYRKRGMRAISEISQNLHYPASAKEFQVRAEEILGQEARKQDYRALDIKFARSSIAADLQIQEHVNTAIFEDDPKKRAAAVDGALGTVNEMVGSGVWHSDVGSTKTAKILETVSLGRAERLFQDPEKQATIVNEMLNGELKYVDPIKQMTTARTWQKQSQENDRQRDQRAKEFWETEQEKNILEYSQLATDKKLTIPELQRNAVQWQWKATEYDRVYALLTAPPKEEASNPATRTRVLADAHSAYPTLSERAILDLGPAPRGNGQLNTTDMLNAIDHRRSTMQHLETEGKSDVQRAYGQGKQRVKSALGIPDIMDKVDDPRMGVWNAALDAYDLRAKGARGTEDPNKVADEVSAQYQIILGRKSIDDLDALNKGLKYKTKQEIEAAATRKVNPISPGEAEAQQRLLMRRDELVKEAAKNQAKRDAEKNKQPEPGGWLNWFRGTPPPANLSR